MRNVYLWSKMEKTLVILLICALVIVGVLLARSKSNDDPSVSITTTTEPTGILASMCEIVEASEGDIDTLVRLLAALALEADASGDAVVTVLRTALEDECPEHLDWVVEGGLGLD